MMHARIRSACRVGQTRVLMPHHEIFPTNSMQASVKKANVASRPIQD